MRKHRIRVLAGDKVTIEMSPYDLNKVESRSATLKRVPAAVLLRDAVPTKPSLLWPAISIFGAHYAKKALRQQPRFFA